MTTLQIMLVLAALYNTALAVLVLLRTSTHRAGRTFAWYILSITAWILCVACVQWHYPDTWNIWFIRGSFASAMLILINWVWFCTDFPTPSLQPIRKIAIGITVVSLLWLLIAWTPLIVPGIDRSHGSLDAVIGPLFVPSYLWIFLASALGIVNLIRRARHVSNIERLQIRYILLGTVAFIISASIPTLVIPVLTGSSAFASYAPFASLFVTTATTYAIVRYRLMDIRLVLRAGISYSVTIAVLCLLYALLVPSFDFLLGRWLPLSDRVSSFLVAFVLALAFDSLLQRVQQVLDKRVFATDMPDARLLLRDACTVLTKGHNRERIAQDFAETLMEMYAPKGVVVYIPGHNDILTSVVRAGGFPDAPVSLSPTDVVLAHAVVTDEVLVADELIRQPAPAHAYGTHLKGWSADVAVPLLAGPQVCGLVLLGEKLSGDVYTADDLGLLRILGKQAAIALINARHFDEMVLLNEYHERLLNTMQDGVLALDPHGRVLTCNPAAAAILGIPAPEALDGTLASLGLGALPHPASGAAALETTLTTRAGATVPVLVTVTPFWRRWETTPCYLLVVRDLSELRALEREKLQAERFSSMGAMAASLAHEIKNPLVPIQTFAHLLPTQYDDAEFREEFSRTVVREVERITRLVGQLLDLVRKPAADRAPVDLGAVADQLLTIIGPECARAGIRVHAAVAPDLPPLHGDAGQLYQALLNVLTNAVQAMPDGGDLWVTLGRAGDTLTVRIHDSGPGVPPDAVGRIFEPLFTTKPGGHGLGLALTYQFVKAHGGEITAEGPPEGGLAITLLLPLRVWEDAAILCQSY